MGGSGVVAPRTETVMEVEKQARGRGQEGEVSDVNMLKQMCL